MVGFVRKVILNVAIVLVFILAGAWGVTQVELSGCNQGGFTAPPMAISTPVTCPCFLQFQFFSDVRSIWDVFFVEESNFQRWNATNYIGAPEYNDDISAVGTEVDAESGKQKQQTNVLLSGNFRIIFRAAAGGVVCFTNPPGVPYNPSEGIFANFIVFESMPSPCPVFVEDPPVQKNQKRIVGGTEAASSGQTLTFFPWIAVIWRRNRSICGGSHIAPGFVLTAAHCNIHQAIQEYTLRIGAVNDDSGPEYEIERVWVHPEYELRDSGDTFNDLAILQIRDRNPDLDTATIALNVDIDSPIPGEYVTTAGYGDISENWSTNPSPNRLRKVDVKVWSNAQCREVGFGEVREEMHICAGEIKGNCDSCQSDSGGPLRYIRSTGNGTRREELAGIVSFGTGCARKGLPGVYAKVSSYVPWIRSVTSGDRDNDGWPNPTSELETGFNLFGGTVGVIVLVAVGVVVLGLLVLLGIFIGKEGSVATSTSMHASTDG